MLLAGLGEAYLELGKLKLAEDAFSEGLQVSEDVGVTEAIARALFGLAQLSLLKGDIEAARKSGTRSLAIFETANVMKAAKNRHWLTQLPQA